MSRADRGRLLGSMRLLWEAGTVTGMSDAQLLQRSTAGGPAAELAFSALVERHGPMVLRVCRRVLRDPHDAHDAFQAAFLVLARRARSIRDPEALASWLHGVALRASRSLAAATARRRVHERRAAAAFRVSTPPREPADPDLGAILHQEVDRLPERFRAAVVLCDLEGLTHEQAAGRLGCPVGTVKSRLSTARDRLRRRLSRRGLAPGAGAVAAALAAESAGSALSIPLMDSTVQAAAMVAAGRAVDASGVVPVAVAALSERVLHAMILTKLKVAATAVASLVVAGVALAQAPATKTADDAPPVNDRLEQLEKKLDRVLQAIEAPRSTVQGTRALTPAANPLRAHSVPAPTITASPDLPAVAPVPVIPSTETAIATMPALERRLERLEQRVERLEKLITSAEYGKPKKPGSDLLPLAR